MGDIGLQGEYNGNETYTIELGNTLDNNPFIISGTKIHSNETKLLLRNTSKLSNYSTVTVHLITSSTEDILPSIYYNIGTVLYSKRIQLDTNTYECVCIITRQNNTEFGIFLSDTNLTLNKTYTTTIKKFSVYNGSFCNPPRTIQNSENIYEDITYSRSFQQRTKAGFPFESPNSPSLIWDLSKQNLVIPLVRFNWVSESHMNFQGMHEIDLSFSCPINYTDVWNYFGSYTLYAAVNQSAAQSFTLTHTSIKSNYTHSESGAGLLTSTSLRIKNTLNTETTKWFDLEFVAVRDGLISRSVQGIYVTGFFTSGYHPDGYLIRDPICYLESK